MTNATIPTYPIAKQDVVGSGCDGCSVLSLVLCGQLLLDKLSTKKKCK
jgi:hypothetical protein